MALTQASYRVGTAARRRLFDHVAMTLNTLCERPEFVVLVLDNVTGPLILHAPTEVRIGLHPTMPEDPDRPFCIWVRLTHRFSMKSDGSFNAPLVLQRVREVSELKLPEV